MAIGRYLAETEGRRADRRPLQQVPPHCDPAAQLLRVVLPPHGRLGPLPDTGTVNTFSLCYVTWDMRYLTDPEIPAVIDIDGTRPAVGIMHMLGEVEPDEVKIGMKVQAVWKPAEEREGSILDIKYFKPL